MKKIKVLHLASFDGNIGDNANHQGFYREFMKNEQLSFDITPLEMREFYWKQRKFDEDFVSLVNNYDLFVFGGGNYFELWVPDSKTGTSFDISLDDFRKIKIPILFNTLGIDPAQGIPEVNINRFQKLLDIIINSDQYLLSIRNDGSEDTLRHYIGEHYLYKTHSVPDGGFNIQTISEPLYKDKPYICINIANDKEEIRYSGKEGYHNYSSFIKEMSKFIEAFVEEYPTYEIIFIPHIFRDLYVINDLLAEITDEYRRRHITVASLMHGKDAVQKIFGLYKGSKLNLSTRFHANVCSIGQGVPTIALSTYRQIRKLYRDLGLSEYLVEVNKRGFTSQLIQIVEAILDEHSVYQKKYIQIAQQQQQEYAKYHTSIEAWLEEYFL